MDKRKIKNNLMFNFCLLSALIIMAGGANDDIKFSLEMIFINILIHGIIALLVSVFIKSKHGEGNKDL